MEIIRMIYLKGSTLPDILSQLGTLSGFAALLYSGAIFSYKKRNN